MLTEIDWATSSGSAKTQTFHCSHGMEHWSELVDNLLTSDSAKLLNSNIIHENEAKVTSLDPIGAVKLHDELHLDPAPPILRPVLFGAISAYLNKSLLAETHSEAPTS